MCVEAVVWTQSQNVRVVGKVGGVRWEVGGGDWDWVEGKGERGCGCGCLEKRMLSFEWVRWARRKASSWRERWVWEVGEMDVIEGWRRMWFANLDRVDLMAESEAMGELLTDGFG